MPKILPKRKPRRVGTRRAVMQAVLHHMREKTKARRAS